MTSSPNAPVLDLKRLQQRALIVGVVFLIILIIGAFFSRDQFFRSYLFGFTFWIGISLGSLALLMLQHLTGGGWGFVILRPLEAATRTLPLLLILFVPIILGAHSLYPWTHDEEIARLGDKIGYLNLRFFVIRSLAYFAVWLMLAYFLNRWSREEDRTGDRRFAKKMRILSGPGMILFVLTVTFASVDWVMSLDPFWTSTMFGFIFVGAWGLSGLAFVIAVTAALAKHSPLNQVAGQRYFHDLGKLLLALVMLWTYFAFSQYLIIWSGNLPEEIVYYLPRTRGGWGVIAVAVAVLHFALPFLFLLSRSVKRDASKLVIVAGLILIMRLVDFFWMIAPNFTGEHLYIGWLDILMNFAAPVAIGGLWLASYCWQLGKMPLVAINDSRYEGVLAQAHAHSSH
ncbi:MAG: hypothetical protein ACRD6N_06855 [Pyrinomonadaceae bacterium]